PPRSAAAGAAAPLLFFPAEEPAPLSHDSAPRRHKRRQQHKQPYKPPKRRTTYPYASHEDPHVRPKTVIPSPVQGAAAPDLEQFRLRRFLEALDDSELDPREAPIDLAD